MEFKVDPKIFEEFPGVKIGVLVLLGIENRKTKVKNEEITALLRKEERRKKKELVGVDLKDLPEISFWREYRSSIEALLRRVQAGNPLPSINPLVDLYNYLSIKHILPAGAEDLDKVRGDIQLTFAKGDETGKYIGGKEIETCYKGEVVYKDDLGFICRRWNWREAERTKIDEETQNAALVLEALPCVSDEKFKKALEDAKVLVQQLLGGKATLKILTESDPKLEIDFETGKKAREKKVEVKKEKKKEVRKEARKEIKVELLKKITNQLVDKSSISYKLQELVWKTAKEFDGNLEIEDVQIEHPANPKHGDYAANIALRLASRKIKGNFLENIEWILKNVTEKNWEDRYGEHSGLPIGRLRKEIGSTIKSTGELIYLKPRVYAKIKGWWKYREGHPEVTLRRWRLLPALLFFPQAIFQNKTEPNRWLFAYYPKHTWTIVIEVLEKERRNEVVTFFVIRKEQVEVLPRVYGVDEKSLLGRTCIPSVLAHLENRNVAGSRFSGLRESYKFYNTLEEKCQEDILNYELRKLPSEWAEEIAATINSQLPACRQGRSTINYLDSVEVAPPGFINFWLSKKFLLDPAVQSIKQKQKYGSSEVGKGKTVIIDYSSPNIARPFGIGHLRSTIIGQALYNIYQFLGWRTIGDNHLGDWGTQFGKLIVAIKKWSKGKIADLKIKDLEALYVRFHQEVEKDSNLDDEARTWFKKLEDEDSEARKMWEACVKISLEEFNRIYELLGVKIGYTFGESFYEDKMAEVIANAKRRGVAKESRGALVIEIPGIKAPLMLLKSDGATTYQTRDLATIKYRLKSWKPDLYIYEVGAEQSLHFRQVFGAAALLGYGETNQFVHVAHGLYRWQEGKFSTRKGVTIHLEEVLSEAIQRAKKLAQKAGISKNLSQEEQEEVARVVGIGAVKYNDLKQRPEQDIIFDWDKVLNLEGNSGPYLQYTYARCRSVLRRAGITNYQLPITKGHGLKFAQTEEIAILRTIYQFPEVVLEAAKNFAPNLICNFLFDLAQKYNNFYNLHPIIRAPSPEIVKSRLALTAATAQVIKNGLALLGIKSLERM